MAKSNTLAELRGWTRYVGLQIEYSLLERTVEQELVPMARDQQMTVLAWSPLRKGVLTGKYLPENVKQSEAEGARMHSEMMKGFGSVEESTHAIVRETVAASEELGVSAAQVALAWLRYRPVPVIPIIGARKVAQLEDNIRSLDVSLSPAQLQRLDKATAVSMGFPQSSMALESVKAMVFGGVRDRIKA